MISFSEARDCINRNLDKLPLKKDPAGLYDPISYIIGIGGKRVRPSLVLMSCNLFTDNFKLAVNPALGIELFHNFTLLHDDIMDEAAVRRSHPTVHNKWDRNTAILSGDAMSIMSYNLISACDEAVVKPVLELFSKTALEVCEGQQMDMDFEAARQVTTQQYLKMIELKTAVLLAASMGIGALVGGAEKKNVDELYMLGKNLGMAFQMRDDYLDVYGEPEVFGKRIGQDILANKKTFLLVRSLELAADKNRNELLDWISHSHPDPQGKISEVTRIYDQLGIKAVAEQAMNGYYQSAMVNLDRVGVADQRKMHIRELVGSLLYRDS